MNIERPKTINALLVDDELDACLNLQSILQTYWSDKIEIAGFALNTDEAEKFLAKNKTPDVVFIDIEMPGENAFQFLERIQPFPFEIIFVTAYDEYALRALKLNAIDYILKPISLDELENSIKKLEEKLEFKAFYKNKLTENIYDELGGQMLHKSDPDKIVLRSRNEIHLLLFKDILYIEAEGSYSNFYFLDHGIIKNIVMSHPLVDYEDLLPQQFFFRIHKSFLVNCQQLMRVVKDEIYTVVMKNGTVLPLSRRRHLGLIKFLKNIRL